MQRGRTVSIYKSTLNTSKQKKEKKEKVSKIKTERPKVINIGKFIAIILMITSAISFVSLCCPSNFIKNFLLGVFGISAYPICLLTLFLCTISMSKTKYEVNKKYTIYLSCALFFVLMVAHLILTTGIDVNAYGQYLADTYNLKTSGAGLIMSLFTYWMKKYLTVVGAYIFAIILLTVFIGLILDTKHVKQQPKQEQPKKSVFDFTGLISENNPKEEPITLQRKQEDLKKQIAKQKLGMESGSSTIISSSMRLDEIPDTPAKYKSKREYILTPPEIVIPEYKKSTVKNEPDKNDLMSKIELNSDIFVSDAEDFYKDAKIIEGKDIDNKINIGNDNLRQNASQDNNFEKENQINHNWQDNKANVNNFEINKNNYEKFEIKPNNITNLDSENINKQSKPEWSNAESNDWQNNIKQVFKDNSELDIHEAEYDNELLDEQYDNIDEEYIEDEVNNANK